MSAADLPQYARPGNGKERNILMKRNYMKTAFVILLCVAILCGCNTQTDPSATKPPTGKNTIELTAYNAREYLNLSIEANGGNRRDLYQSITVDGTISRKNIAYYFHDCIVKQRRVEHRRFSRAIMRPRCVKAPRQYCILPAVFAFRRHKIAPRELRSICGRGGRVRFCVGCSQAYKIWQEHTARKRAVRRVHRRRGSTLLCLKSLLLLRVTGIIRKYTLPFLFRFSGGVLSACLKKLMYRLIIIRLHALITISYPQQALLQILFYYNEHPGVFLYSRKATIALLIVLPKIRTGFSLFPAVKNISDGNKFSN